MRRYCFLSAAAMATALMAHAGELPDFADFDADADGVVSQAEFVAYKTTDGQLSEAEAVAKFIRFDLNGDGELTEPELSKAVEAWRSSDQLSDFENASETK